jgi:hypothetical protein
MISQTQLDTQCMYDCFKKRMYEHICNGNYNMAEYYKASLLSWCLLNGAKDTMTCMENSDET